MRTATQASTNDTPAHARRRPEHLRAPGGPPEVAGRVPAAAMAAALAAAVACTFAPWLRSGATDRHSYDVVRAADRLGVLDPGVQESVAAAWFFVPFVAAVALVLVTMQRHRLAAAAAASVGLGEVGLALAVSSSPRDAMWGARAGLAAGSSVLVLAVATAMAGSMRRSP